MDEGKKSVTEYSDTTMIALIGSALRDDLSYDFAFYVDRVLITSFDSAGYRLTPAKRNTTRTHAHAHTLDDARTRARSRYRRASSTELYIDLTSW